MNKSNPRELLMDSNAVDSSVIGSSSSCNKMPMNHHCNDQHSTDVISQARPWTTNITKNDGFRFEDDDDDDVDGEFEYIPLWRADDGSCQKDSNGIDPSIVANCESRSAVTCRIDTGVSSSIGSNSSNPSEDDILPVDNTDSGKNDCLYATHPLSIPTMPMEDVSSLAAICSQISSSPIESRLSRFSEASPPTTKRGEMHRRKRVRSAAKVDSSIHATCDISKSNLGHSKGDGCFSEVPNSQQSTSPGKNSRTSVANTVTNKSPVVRCPPPIPPRHNINAALPAVLQVTSEFHGSDGVVLVESEEDHTSGCSRASKCSDLISVTDGCRDDMKRSSQYVRGMANAPPLGDIQNVSCSNSIEDNIYEEVPFSKIYEDLNDIRNGSDMVSDYSGSGDSGVTMRVRSATDSVVTSAYANRKSLVEEVMYEVERVQRQHDQVLKELNLDMEAMIMPPPHSSPHPYSDHNSSNGMSENYGPHYNGGCEVVMTPPTSRKHSAVSVGLPSSTASSDIPRVYPHVRSLSLSACSQRDLPSLPSRTSSPLSFLKRDSLKLNQGAVTSTPVAKRKWIKLPSLSGSKGKAIQSKMD